MLAILAFFSVLSVLDEVSLPSQTDPTLLVAKGDIGTHAATATPTAVISPCSFCELHISPENYR